MTCVRSYARQISIHAPHARSDVSRDFRKKGVCSISIHAPHARSDCSGWKQKYLLHSFQSTLLMRGAT